MDHDGLDLRIVERRTDDGASVDLAILLTATGGAPRTGIVHVHGKGGNFLGLPLRALARRMDVPDAVHVAVNMRCHDLGYTRTDVPSADSVVEADVDVGGGWWEDLTLGAHDIEAAVQHARFLGCREVFVIGHSAGGFYAADHAARYGGIGGLVALSPLTDNKTNLSRWFPAPGQLEQALAHARSLVDHGRGHHILPLEAWYYGVSARTLLQRAAEPDLVWQTNLERAGLPLLVLWGSLESRRTLFRKVVEELGITDKQTVELIGCEHNYIGFEAAAAGHATEFILARQAGAAD